MSVTLRDPSGRCAASRRRAFRTPRHRVMALDAGHRSGSRGEADLLDETFGVERRLDLARRFAAPARIAVVFDFCGNLDLRTHETTSSFSTQRTCPINRNRGAVDVSAPRRARGARRAKPSYYRRFREAQTDGAERSEEDCPRLFGRAGHVGHPSLAERALSGCHARGVRRRARAGQRAQRHRAEGEAERRRRGRGPGSSPRVRRGVLLPDAPRARHLRGRLPAGNVDRPSAHREGASRRRAPDRRRRRRSRGDRQGQRSSALRADVHGARSDADDRLALEGPALPRRRSHRP